MRCALFCFFTAFTIFANPEAIPKRQLDFMSNYCLDCHDEDTSKGDVSLDFLKVNWQSQKVREHWSDVYTMLERDKMPPKKKDQPSKAEKAEMMKWLNQKLVSNSVIGGAPMRRLNKREHEMSIRQVFGFYDFELPDSYPEDIKSHGFDTVAEKLVVSGSHLEAYNETAIKVADYFFPPVDTKVKAVKFNIPPADMTISYSSAYIIDGAMRLASSGAKT